MIRLAKEMINELEKKEGIYRINAYDACFAKVQIYKSIKISLD